MVWTGEMKRTELKCEHICIFRFLVQYLIRAGASVQSLVLKLYTTFELLHLFPSFLLSLSLLHSAATSPSAHERDDNPEWSW